MNYLNEDIDMFFYECQCELNDIQLEHEVNLERIESQFLCESGDIDELEELYTEATEQMVEKKKNVFGTMIDKMVKFIKDVVDKIKEKINKISGKSDEDKIVEVKDDPDKLYQRIKKVDSEIRASLSGKKIKADDDNQSKKPIKIKLGLLKSKIERNSAALLGLSTALLLIKNKIDKNEYDKIMTGARTDNDILTENIKVANQKITNLSRECNDYIKHLHMIMKLDHHERYAIKGELDSKGKLTYSKDANFGEPKYYDI